MFIRTHALTRGDVVIVRIVPLLRRVLLLQTGGGGVDRGLNATLAFLIFRIVPVLTRVLMVKTWGGGGGRLSLVSMQNEPLIN